MEGVEPEQRNDDDTWDLATSVGATATMMDAARAVASAMDQSLIRDVFAERLVCAVGVEFLTRWVSAELGPADDGMQRVLHWFADLMTVRTRYFDAFLLDAATAGIRQVVKLASGLDIEPCDLAYDGERNDVAWYLDNREWPFAENRYYTSIRPDGS